MSLSYDEGVALAVAVDGANRQASGVANRANMDADIAMSHVRRAGYELEAMTKSRDEWRDSFCKKSVESICNSRAASVGLIFMGAFQEALEKMSKDQAEKFLEDVRSLTQSRIDLLDKKHSEIAKSKNLDYISINSEFVKMKQHKSLEFDK